MPKKKRKKKGENLEPYMWSRILAFNKYIDSQFTTKANFLFGVIMLPHTPITDLLILHSSLLF